MKLLFKVGKLVSVPNNVGEPDTREPVYRRWKLSPLPKIVAPPDVAREIPQAVKLAPLPKITAVEVERSAPKKINLQPTLSSLRKKENQT